MQKTNIKCLGFTMDGSRRWAKKNNLPSIEGHRKGTEVFKEVVEFVTEQSIPHAIFYAFSSENWNRSEEEVAGLIGLFTEKLSELDKEMEDGSSTNKKARLRFVGDLEKFPVFLQEKITEIENKTKDYVGTTIWIALSYGGRAEIVQAVNQAVEKGQSVTEESFEKMLWTAGMPDPDMLVRTGGQQRLSNFLLWQSTYSELVFVDTLWPDFTRESLSELIESFSERHRNFGK